MAAQSLPSLIKQMMRSEFYSHRTQEPIELIQTHTAYVLLTGDYAYKIKKPVNYGFLDYSTLAARKHYSEAEVQLNRRTAAEIYLDAIPIYQQGERFSLRPQGTPVEYAVKMKQFPAGSLFSDLMERGQLVPSLMEKLACEVAQFHQQAATNAEIQAYGRIDQIRQAFDQNYQQSLPYVGRGQTQRQLDETRAYSDRAFANWTARFHTRIHQQKIRDCHGDLHLRNICLWQDRIFLFDCIEFNRAFRYVDTMHDIAFTIMDCDARGHSELGNAFLNTYLEETGDWQGLEVLPLYLSRQAYVRAKVTSFLLDDPANQEQNQKLQAQAQAYYTQAWRYTQPRRGQLVLMSGLSGSGKSTVARQLAQAVGAIHIRSDAVRKHLAGMPLRQRGDTSLYSSAMTQKTYGRLAELGLRLAKLGNCVILDAKYDRIATRQAIIHQAQAAHIPISIAVCQAPVEVLCQRLQQRTGDIADATAELLTSQRATAEALTDEEKPLAIYLNTAEDIEPAVQAVAANLRPVIA